MSPSHSTLLGESPNGPVLYVFILSLFEVGLMQVWSTGGFSPICPESLSAR